MSSCSVVGSCVKTSVYTAARKLLYNIQNFASIDSSVWFLYARCIILLQWIPLHDFLWSVPWSPLKAIKLLFSPPYMMSIILHLWTSKNYIFFHILSRDFPPPPPKCLWWNQNFPEFMCIWPFKNEIGIMVFEDSCVDNLLPKFTLFTVLNGIAQMPCVLIGIVVPDILSDMILVLCLLKYHNEQHCNKFIPYIGI